MTLLDQYKKQILDKPRPVEIIAHVPELSELIKLLYMQMQEKQQQKQEQDESLVDIVGMPMIQTKAWYNQGDSRVSEG
jgi:hypothetical protein|tara:strand:+ start:291 stop:524 length:234 start_codon:yes stop_codon:yes gene_type:complete